MPGKRRKKKTEEKKKAEVAAELPPWQSFVIQDEEGQAAVVQKDLLWTYDEDRLLVHARDFKPVMEWERVILLYRQYHQKFPHLYPREHLRTFDASKRLQDLLTPINGAPSPRLRLLRRDIAFSNRDKYKEKKSVKPSETTAANGKGSAKIEITLSGRNFPAATIVADRDAVCKQSPYIREHIERVPSSRGRNPRVHLSDEDARYDGINTLNHFCKENVQRFVRWCENPGVVEEAKAVKEELTSVVSSYSTLKSDLEAEADQAKHAQLEKVIAARTEEEERMAALMTQRFEEDIAELRHQHEIQVKREVEKIRRRFSRAESALLESWERARQHTLHIANTLAMQELGSLEEKAALAHGVVSSLFQSESACSLLLLADELEASDLSAATVSYIADTFDTIGSSSQLSSGLFSADLHQSILRAMSDAQVIQSSRSRRCALPKELVTQEVAYRKQIAMSRFAAASIDELKDAIEERSGAFSALAKRELTLRTATNPAVCIDVTPDFACPYAVVSADGLEVTPNCANRYAAVHASHGRRHLGQGCWLFELTVVSCPQDGKGSISVGWDTSRESLNGAVPGLTREEGDAATVRHGLMWQSDGYLYIDGDGQFTRLGFGSSDVVGCALNQKDKTITYYKNGSEAHTVNIPDKNYHLKPAVCLYTSGNASACRTKFNFTGPFVTKVGKKAMLPFGGTGELDASLLM